MNCYRYPVAGDMATDDCPRCGHLVMVHRRDGAPGGSCPLCQLDRLLVDLEEYAAVRKAVGQ